MKIIATSLLLAVIGAFAVGETTVDPSAEHQPSEGDRDLLEEATVPEDFDFPDYKEEGSGPDDRELKMEPDADHRELGGYYGGGGGYYGGGGYRNRGYSHGHQSYYSAPRRYYGGGEYYGGKGKGYRRYGGGGYGYNYGYRAGGYYYGGKAKAKGGYYRN